MSGVVIAAMLLLLLAGCISDEKEREIGTTMAAEVNPHLPIVQSAVLNTYIHRVGRQLGAVSGRDDLDFRFYIINTDAVNAFALPGGHVYVTRGLIERTRDGSQFAAALAHEIGHVAARHGIRKLQRELRTGSLVNALYNTILGGEPTLLQENSLQLASIIWSAQHSRKDEREADRLAVEYLVETGVDPEGVVTLLESFLREDAAGMDEFGRLEMLLSTHPLTRTRITDAQDDIAQLNGETNPVTTIDLRAFPVFRGLVLESAPEILELVPQ